MAPDTEHLHAERAADLERAAELLRAGGVVAVPTETVYGLAADARNDAAVRRIFEAKGRPADHPLIVHLPDAGALRQWARAVPDRALLLADAFWPGPLTLLLERGPAVSDVVTGGLRTVGLRVPAQPVLLDLLRRLGTGLAAPSANPYRSLSPTRAEHVLAGLRGRIDAVLDDGPCALGLESTIVDLSGDHPRLVRPGPITRAELERVLGCPVRAADGSVRAPGTEEIHYRPRAELRVLGEAALLREHERLRAAGARHGLLLRGETAVLAGDVPVVRLPVDRAGYARGLYAALHVLDAAGAPVILAQAPPDDPAWADVRDRLSRAATSWGGKAMTDRRRGPPDR